MTNHAPAAHGTDSDCTIDPATNSCTGCGVDHSGWCPKCDGHAFHKTGCPASDQTELPGGLLSSTHSTNTPASLAGESVPEASTVASRSVPTGSAEPDAPLAEGNAPGAAAGWRSAALHDHASTVGTFVRVVDGPLVAEFSGEDCQVLAEAFRSGGDA